MNGFRRWCRERSAGPAGRPADRDSLRGCAGRHWDFLEHDLLDYYETNSHIFVHAGVLCDLPMDEQPDYALFWEFLPDACEHVSGKTIVCGHTSQRSGEMMIIPGAVCIDTYAYGGGWLTCLDAISGHFWQVDQPVKGGRVWWIISSGRAGLSGCSRRSNRRKSYSRLPTPPARAIAISSEVSRDD